jgi:protein-tyrosine-phosphatase
MHIGLVCTMNQARSPFAEMVLAANFPEHDFFSTGVKAIYGTPIMDSVAAAAKEWGLQSPKKGSTTIYNDEAKILISDLIVVAESDQKKSISEMGYSKSIRAYSEIFEDPDFTPRDPEGLPFDALKRELGKVVAVSLRAVLDADGYSHKYPVIAVTPHGVSDLGMALAHAQLERVDRKAILIDGDIRAPHDMEIANAGLERVFFDISKLDECDYASLAPNQILTHIREVDYPEKFFVKGLWRNFLGKMSQIAPVVVLTAPRHSHMRKLADSYLASYMADEFSVISC